MICRTQAPKQQRSWLHSVLCGQPYKRIAAPGYMLARPANSPQSPPYSHSIWRLYTASIPLPARPHRPRGAPSDVSGLHVLPHCSRPIHPLARSRPHPGHHSRHRGTRPTNRLDIQLRLPADDHHRPGTSVRIHTLPIPGHAVWHSALADNRLRPRGLRTRGTLPPDIESSHHVPHGPAVDRGASPDNLWNPHGIQGPAGIGS
jgi:hypothetical protein